MSDNYIGDFKEDQDIKFTFPTRDKSGGAVTYSGGTIKVYKNVAGTGNTSSVTVVKDTPQTGIHRVTLDGTDAFYTKGADYQVEAEGLTVDGETINDTIAEFSVENRSNEKTLAKLPDNNIMGSSVKSNKDDEIDSIKTTVDNNLDATVSSRASETNATANKNTVVGEVNANETKIDNLQGDMDDVHGKLPTGDIADESSVNAIQNNTRFSSSPPTPVLIPDSGNMIFKISCGLFDTDGNPEDPDVQETVPLMAIKARAINGQADKTAFFDDESGSTGATASTTYGTPYVRMVKDSTGRFSTYYKLPDSENPDNWTFTFKYAENSVEFVRERSITVADQSQDTVTLEDSNANKDVIIEAIKQRGNVTAPAANTIMDDLVTEIDENETKIDAVQSTADDIDAKTTNLPTDPASETNATSNKDEVISEVDDNETKIDAVQSTADNIDAKTTNLPTDPTSETNATANKDEIIVEVDENETKLDDIISTLGSGVIDANLVQVNGSSTIDGTQIKLVLELVQAMVNGRFKKDFPIEGQVTFYKRDNTSVLTIIQVTETERTRIS